MPNAEGLRVPTLLRCDMANEAQWPLLPVAPDMPDDLAAALRAHSEACLAVRVDETTVGVALVMEEEDAFALAYIVPPYRGKGYGAAAARLAEALAFTAGAKRITTAYRPDCPAGAALARALGYERRFSSAYLTCKKRAFATDNAHMRAYTDADYPAAQSLSARAFHQMRLAVGDFPDSVVTEPSAQMRQAWAADADKRRVWVENGVVIGYAMVSNNELESFAVAPERQRQGIGRRFLAALCAEMLQSGHDEIGLYCVVGNPARGLYESAGFTEMGVNVYAVKTRD